MTIGQPSQGRGKISPESETTKKTIRSFFYTFASADGVVLSLFVDGGEGEKDNGAGVTGAGQRGLS
jgi:hypothetical protein